MWPDSNVGGGQMADGGPYSPVRSPTAYTSGDMAYQNGGGMQQVAYVMPQSGGMQQGFQQQQPQQQQGGYPQRYDQGYGQGSMTPTHGMMPSPYNGTPAESVTPTVGTPGDGGMMYVPQYGAQPGTPGVPSDNLMGFVSTVPQGSAAGQMPQGFVMNAVHSPGTQSPAMGTPAMVMGSPAMVMGSPTMGHPGMQMQAMQSPGGIPSPGAGYTSPGAFGAPVPQPPVPGQQQQQQQQQQQGQGQGQGQQKSGQPASFSRITEDSESRHTNLHGWVIKKMLIENRHTVTELDVPARFEIMEILGQGAQGVTCAAKTHQGDMVAIKKCVTVRNLGMAHRVLRELRLLRELAHDNVVTLYGVYCSGSKQNDLGQMYAIMELVDGDLSYVLSSKSQSLTQAHVTYMAYQLLCGLKYIHSAGVMHRDISPGNLLVNKTCELKICDFGLARLTSEHAGSLSEEQDTKMSMYVCTRWYRAPELLCFLPRYGTEVDIWSAGCVIMELHTRRPLLPGDSTMHQIELIINVLGFPEGCAAKVDNARIRAFLEQKRSSEGPASQRFKQLLQAVVSRNIMQASAADLIERMLCLEQEQRSTAAELLENGFVAEYHDSNEEPVRSPIDPSLFDFERRELDKASVQTEFLREMAAYHSSIVIEGEASG